MELFKVQNKSGINMIRSVDEVKECKELKEVKSQSQSDSNRQKEAADVQLKFKKEVDNKAISLKQQIETLTNHQKTYQDTVKALQETVESQQSIIYEQEIKIQSHREIACSFMDELCDEDGINEEDNHEEREENQVKQIATLYKQLEELQTSFAAGTRDKLAVEDALKECKQMIDNKDKNLKKMEAARAQDIKDLKQMVQKEENSNLNSSKKEENSNLNRSKKDSNQVC